MNELDNCQRCGAMTIAPNKLCENCFGEDIVQDCEKPQPGTWMEDDDIEDMENRFLCCQKQIDYCNNLLNNTVLEPIQFKKVEEAKRRWWQKQQDEVMSIYMRRKAKRI